MNPIVADLLIILAAGLMSGVVCKRLGLSLLVGYLVVGAIIGPGGLQLVSQQHHDLEALASAGALFLLFAVGIEFSLEELVRLSRFILLGGAVQMLLVSVPLLLVCLAFGLPPRAALLAAAAAALSSTVLVFKALSEWGHAASPHGRRGISILLFQDIALVPLMLLVPLLTGEGEGPTATAYLLLTVKSTFFVAAVLGLRAAIARWGIPLLAGLRSVELVVLFALSVLGGTCFGAYSLGLPAAVGALAAGLMLSGNRLSKQVDTLVLPYRESFAALFFVTLGTLLDLELFLKEPLLLLAGLAGMLLLKSAAATMALRVIGLPWRSALGMGIGLAQLGEFSFLLIAEGVGRGVISPLDYNRMLFVAIGTLILTPQLLKVGLRWTGGRDDELPEEAAGSIRGAEVIPSALVIGLGPIGRQIASRLETEGVDAHLVDLSPINLHAFGQQGFHTVAGDARELDVLRRAGGADCQLAIISVPDDFVAGQVVRSFREVNGTAALVVRCRYLQNVAGLKKAGADTVISEEAQASEALLRICGEMIAGSGVLGSREPGSGERRGESGEPAENPGDVQR